MHQVFQRPSPRENPGKSGTDGGFSDFCSPFPPNRACHLSLEYWEMSVCPGFSRANLLSPCVAIMMIKRDLLGSGPLLLGLAAVILLREGLAGPPVFQGEFVAEDFVVFLLLVCGLVPKKFKPLVWYLAISSMSLTMAIAAWTIGEQKFPLAESVTSTSVLVIIATINAVLGAKELVSLPGRGKVGLKGTDRIDALANPENGAINLGGKRGKRDSLSSPTRGFQK